MFYWVGIQGDEELLIEAQKVIEKIEGGYATSLDFEELNNFDGLFSVRLNNRDRALLLEIEVGNKRKILYLVEIVRQHKYESARFMQPGVIAKFRQKHADAIRKELIAAGYVADKDDGKSSYIKTKNKVKVEFIDGQALIFNPWQEKVLEAKSHSIILGSPGSGKSSTALALITQTLENSYEEGEIWYVTYEQELIDSIKQQWQQMPAYLINPEKQHRVHFKTYEDVARELSATPLKIVDKNYCRQWLVNYVKKQQKLKENSSLSASFWQVKDTFYDEFYLISGCKSEGHYVNDIGVRQSQFKDKNERTWLWKTYQHYLAHLTSQDLCDLPFYRFDLSKKPNICKVIVDEVQQFSLLESINLLQLCPQVVYFGDRYQQSVTNVCVIPVLQSYLHACTKEAGNYDLPFSYRCSEAALSFANRLIYLENHLAEGVVSKDAYSEIDLSLIKPVNKGQVYWLNESEFAERKDLLADPNCAVITLPELIDDAKKHCDTQLVFSYLDCQGLEFKKVRFWKLFNLPVFQEISQKVKLLDLSKPPKRNRARSENAGNQYRKFFHGVFVAATRTLGDIEVVQNVPSKLVPFSNALKQITSQTTSEEISKTVPPKENTSIDTPESIQQAWYEKTQYLLEKGYGKQAKDIYIHQLGHTEQEYETYLETHKRKVQPTSANSAHVSTPPVKIRLQPQSRRKVAEKERKSITPITQKPTSNLAGNKKFVLDVYEKLTEKNLKIIFEHKNVFIYLFETECGEYDCLVNKIASNPHKKRIFLNFIGAHRELVAKIDGKYLCSKNTSSNIEPLILLLKNEESLEILMALLNQHPKIYLELHFNFGNNIILIPFLTLLNVSSGKVFIDSIVGQFAHSALTNFPLIGLQKGQLIQKLSELPSGRRLISAILLNNKHYIKDVSKLFFVNDVANQSSEKLPIYFYAISEKDHEFIFDILECDNYFSNYFKGKILFNELNNSFGYQSDLSNNTLFTHFSTTNFGRKLLNKLFEINSCLIDEMTGINLFEPIKGKSKFKDYYPFVLLIFFKERQEGCNIIKSIFTRQPSLACFITKQKLFSPICFDFNLNLFAFLIAMENFIEIFSIILEQNPSLVLEFTAHDFFKNIKIHNELFSLYDLFTSCPQRKEFLYNKIYALNPQLKTNIEQYKAKQREIAEKLNKPIRQDDPNFSALAILEAALSEDSSKLNSSKENSGFLSNNHSFNQENKPINAVTRIPALSNVPLNIFTNPQLKFEAFFENIFLLFNKPYYEQLYKKHMSVITYITSHDELTSAFIQYLRKNPIQTLKISSNVLCEPLKQGKHQGLVPFNLLTRSENGLKILHEILVLNQKSHGFYIYFSQKRYSGKYTEFNWPLHDILLSSEVGASIVDLLLKKWPDCFLGITYETLIESDFTHSSLLYLLSQCNPNYRSILFKLLNHQELVEQLRLDDLFEIVDKQGSHAFFNLASDINGCRLLESLLNKEKRLIQSVAIELLTLLVNTQTSSVATNSLLELSKTYEGQEVLQTLVMNNKKFARSITANMLIKATSEYDAPIIFLMHNTKLNKLGYTILSNLLQHNKSLPSQMYHQLLASENGTKACVYFLLRFFVTEAYDLLLLFLETDPTFAQSIILDDWRQRFHNDKMLVEILLANDIGQRVLYSWRKWNKKLLTTEQSRQDFDEKFKQLILETPHKKTTLPTVKFDLEEWFEEKYKNASNKMTYFINNHKLCTNFLEKMNGVLLDYKVSVDFETYVCSPIKRGINKKIIPLQFMLVKPLGIAFLGVLIAKRSRSFLNFSLSNLKSQLVDTHSDLNWPLHQALSNTMGLIFFRALALFNPWAYRNLSANLLFSSNDKYQPLLHVLAQLEVSEILETVIDQNKELFYFLTYDNWFKEWPNSFKNSHCLFFYLAKNHPAVLADLLTDKIIFSMANSHLFQTQFVENNKITCFAALSTCSEGLMVLLTILRKNKALIKHMKAEDLCFILATGQASQPIFILANLLSTSEGHMILRLLFDEKPDLLVEVCMHTQDLSAIKVIEYNFFEMLAYEGHIELLTHFLLNQPNFKIAFNDYLEKLPSNLLIKFVNCLTNTLERDELVKHLPKLNQQFYLQEAKKQEQEQTNRFEFFSKPTILVNNLINYRSKLVEYDPTTSLSS